MSDSGKGRKHEHTVPMGIAEGNRLFERAVAAIGMDDGTVRWLLVSALKTVGASPKALTPDELGTMLPEVDRRLRQLVQPEQADKAMARLYQTLMDWAGG
jgi:hypothetical protein